MKDSPISALTRRTWLKASALIVGASVIDVKTAEASFLEKAKKTPPLTPAEITSIEAAR